MGKLHELLAVEDSLKAAAQRMLSRIESLFSDGKSKLVGKIRTYQSVNEQGETFEPEIELLTTTVMKEMVEVEKAWAAYIDATVQKECSNQNTEADLKVGDVTLVEGLPATALLTLEKKLESLRAMYAAIPTNDPAERWTLDNQTGHYVSDPRVTYRTNKVPRVIELSPATERHPAQVQMINEDVRVGTWTTSIQSGMMSPVDKAALLERLDKLAQAVKQARVRANDVEASNVRVAETLFTYIHGGVV